MLRTPLRVDTSIDLDFIRESMGAKTEDSLGEMKILGVCLDSRCLQKGDLFFALCGERDGHQFVKAAFDKGAIAAVVHHEIPAPGPLLLVEDTTQALGALAKAFRKYWGKTVVGISGSNGKTTTKEMVSALLGTQGSIHKSPGSWNNKLGLPLTILQLRQTHNIAVLEMGISESGELKNMCDIAMPNVGVLTNVGPVHLETLQSIEGVAREKGELFQALGKSGVAVINMDDDHISSLAEHLQSKKVTVSITGDADVSCLHSGESSFDGVELTVKYGKSEVALTSSYLGTHNISNLLCSLGVALSQGIRAENLQAGLDQAVHPDMRMEVHILSQDINLINDCYNANPVSTKAALRFVSQVSKGNYWAVIGDMKELGEGAQALHHEIGQEAAKLQFSRLFLMGQHKADIRNGAVKGGMDEQFIVMSDDVKEVVQMMKSSVHSGDTILVKGSRGMKMEQVTEEFEKRMKGSQD